MPHSPCLTARASLPVPHCPCLTARAFTARASSQVSDAGIEGLAAGCCALRHLSLNNIPALGDLALVALRKCCARSLTTLDLSWCRGVSDLGLGALVGASPRLERVSIWGCSQLTKCFFDGHSNDALRIVGRCFA